MRVENTSMQINKKTMKAFSFLSKLMISAYVFLMVVLWVYARDIVLLLLVVIPSAIVIGVVETLLALLRIVYDYLFNQEDAQGQQG